MTGERVVGGRPQRLACFGVCLAALHAVQRRLCRGVLPPIHHKHLQSVFKVGLTDIGVKIQRQDLCIGIKFLESFGNTAAHHMVGQAAKRL